MNVYTFLKSVSGKLVMGLPQMLAIGGVAVLATYGAYEADTTQANRQRSLRSVTAIASSSASEGLRQQNGLLTSINIKDSLNQVATAEERAALEGASGAADNFGLDYVDNVKNVSFGAAAETSTTDGLGMGANKAVDLGAATQAAASSAGVGMNPSAAAAAVQERGSAEGKTGGRPTLAAASMARASGNAFNASSSSGSGSSAGGSSRASSSSGRGASSAGAAGGTSEGYRFSGAMPEGSNAVSAMELTRSSSSFGSRGRDSSVSRATRAFREKDDLKDISKRSADAAKNRNRAANEGSRAWLASSKNSGGMAVEGGVSTGESAGSADFKSPEASQLKAIGDWQEQEDTEAEKQDKARKLLMWMIIGLVGVTLGAMALGYYLISTGKMATPVTSWMVGLGWAVLGIAMVAAAGVIVHAGMYQHNYKSLFLPIVGYVIGGAALATLIMTGISAGKVGAAKNTKTQAAFIGKALSGLKTVGLGIGEKVAMSGLEKVMESDAEMAQQKLEQNKNNQKS